MYLFFRLGREHFSFLGGGWQLFWMESNLFSFNRVSDDM